MLYVREGHVQQFYRNPQKEFGTISPLLVAKSGSTSNFRARFNISLYKDYIKINIIDEGSQPPVLYIPSVENLLNNNCKYLATPSFVRILEAMEIYDLVYLCLYPISIWRWMGDGYISKLIVSDEEELLSNLMKAILRFTIGDTDIFLKSFIECLKEHNDRVYQIVRETMIKLNFQD
jgi:hypothetical protein